PPLAVKMLPVTARVRFWSDGFQELANVIAVFLLLTAGGIASIWVHCGMPNTTRALALQRRLNALGQQIDALGTDIASQWRVLLASHPRRLCRSLSSMWWVFPAFAELLDRLEIDVTMVESWGAIAYDVSIVKRQMRQQQQQGIPPTVLSWVDDACARALAPIETGLTNAEELQSMRADVRKARAYLALVADGTQIADLEKEVADRETRIQGCLPIVAKAWPDEFGNLVEQVSNSIGTPMEPDLYIDRDTLTLKVSLLNEFRALRERAQALEPSAMAAAAGGVVTGSPSESTVTRLEAHRERLFAYLRPDAPESLRLARLFVGEMRQDIYERALLVEMRKTPPAVMMRAQPLIAEPEAPVHFALCFNRDLLNDAAACQEWACTWNFGDGALRETGWEVYHSFSKDGLYDVAVEIADLDGQPVTSAPIVQKAQVGRLVGPIPAAERIRRAWRWTKPHAETMLEASRLALVLAVAVFGLVTTARQQATTLTTLEAIGAVFALGFGADTLKTLITERRS
ncbi:MAG TPA: PKD domain-containing protein, partial [Bryobacteraceae bacterium]|nr:PKD domain-containing protein [Bryobacteraceae bacterium]